MEKVLSETGKGMSFEAGVEEGGVVLTSSGQSQDDRRGPVGKE